MFRGKHWAKNVFSLTLRRVAVLHAVSRADFRVRCVHAAFLHVKAADCPFVTSCRVAAALHGVPERVHRLNRLYITNNAALFSSTFLLMLCVSRACLGKHDDGFSWSSKEMANEKNRKTRQDKTSPLVLSCLVLSCLLEFPHRDIVVERALEHIPAKNTSLFLSFPYVCPEPVLAKRSFLYINGAKKCVRVLTVGT